MITYKKHNDQFVICDEKGDNIHFAAPIVCESENNAREVVNVINTFDTLDRELDRVLDGDDYTRQSFEAAFAAVWMYYAEHYDVLSKVGDDL